METIVLAIESDGNSQSGAVERMARRLNDLIGERVPGHEDYVAHRILSVNLMPATYDGFLEYWEVYALAVIEVKPL